MLLISAIRPFQLNLTAWAGRKLVSSPALESRRERVRKRGGAKRLASKSAKIVKITAFQQQLEI